MDGDRIALPRIHASQGWLPLGAFAWRLSREGMARVPGLYRRGDLVIIARELWEVRHEGRVVLSRIAWADGRLVLLGAADQPAGTSVLEARGESGLRKLVVGRVIAAVQRFR